jgi:hypothetical protein
MPHAQHRAQRSMAWLARTAGTPHHDTKTRASPYAEEGHATNICKHTQMHAQNKTPAQRMETPQTVHGECGRLQSVSQSGSQAGRVLSGVRGVYRGSMRVRGGGARTLWRRCAASASADGSSASGSSADGSSAAGSSAAGSSATDSSATGSAATDSRAASCSACTAGTASSAAGPTDALAAAAAAALAARDLAAHNHDRPMRRRMPS